MNKSGLEEVERVIWEEIARDLDRERGVEKCLCFNRRFFQYLRAAAPSFPLESYSGDLPAEGTAGLFLGWQVLEAGRPLLSPGEIFSALGAKGEARLFGYYSSPRPDDLREWAGRAEPGRLPPPEAVSLGAIAGWLKTGSFDRYTLRKRGIYYECRLQKDA
jgi:hypothetical protein